MARLDEKELNALREGGSRLARILDHVGSLAVPGVSTAHLNEVAEHMIREGGDTPAFLGYQPHGSDRPFPAALCVSINNEVVHGIPNEDPTILKSGDIVTLDAGLTHEGIVADMAITVGVGGIDPAAQTLIEAAEEARAAAIEAAVGGAMTGDIGAAVEVVATKYGFNVVEELGGHGVGHKVHEEPFIPNFGQPGTGQQLLRGMTIAVEPIISEGGGDVDLAPDGYTYITADGSRTAQFEHTILIKDGSAEILTVEK